MRSWLGGREDEDMVFAPLAERAREKERLETAMGRLCPGWVGIAEVEFNTRVGLEDRTAAVDEQVEALWLFNGGGWC